MELSTRYDPKAAEARWLPEWEKHGYFHAEAKSPRPSYCIVIPPPNITGILHMGHALNNTIQDVLIRWKRMAGFNTLWVPGTDHASIATQYVVEAKLREEGFENPRRDLGREKFLERVWEWKEKNGGIIIEQLKRLGCSCDWKRERFTMDEGLSRAVGVVFKRLYDEGLIYKGNYLVNWCPRCMTTLADDEVDYADKNGKLWYIKYPIEGEPGQFAIVATTRPETMLGDTAVAVNPTDVRYKALIGKHAIVPFVNRRIPIIADEFVDKNFGTGMVKITPAHDLNDYQAGKRHGLEEINVLTPDAKINDVCPAYKGMDRYVARKKILADLEADGLLLETQDNPQRVGQCYRCNTAIEPYISLQWFVKIRPLAEPATRAVKSGRVKFTPAARDREYFHWMENVRDWPISRQLWWGHRIPAWYCECGEITVTEGEAPAACGKCGSAKITQDPDVLDTWFSSALWPFSTLGWPDKTDELKTFYPTQTLVTGKEIIFFWVARMIMMGQHFMGDVPFSNVYFNPVVADEHGKKMSKSKGNVINPLALIDEFGADALRITLCDYATQEQYVAFSPKRCEGYRNFINKLWNATRLIFANVGDLTRQELDRALPIDGITPKLALEDRWILSRYAKTIAAANKALETFAFDTAVKEIYDFIWKDFCDYYLELVKPRLYANPTDRSAQPAEIISRKTAQGVLVTILEGSLRLLHPLCPFITEEIWQAMREMWLEDPSVSSPPPLDTAGLVGSILHGQPLGERTLEAFESPSITIAPWNTIERGLFIDDDAEREMELLQSVVYTIRNIRGEMKIGPGVRARVHLVTQDKATGEALKRQAQFFTTLTNLSSLEITNNAAPPAFAATGVAGSVTIHVELPEEMRGQEIARLQKEMAKSEADRQRLAAKLSNESFTAKAPPEVVVKEREKLAQMLDEHKQLEARLAELQKA